MKKTKLLLSLAMMCLSIAVLCFGVLAATNVKYGINGTISYTVSDAYVNITTKVYTSNAQTNSADTLKTYANKFVNEIPTTLGTNLTVTHQTSYDGKFDFNSLTGTLGTNDTYGSTDEIEMAFGSETTDVYSMYIVVNIVNLADSTVYTHMSNFTNDITNVVGACTDNDLRVFKTDTSGITIVVAYSIAEKTQSVETSNFSFSLQIRANEQFSYGQLTSDQFLSDYQRNDNETAKYSSKLKNIIFTNNSADFDMTKITTDDEDCVVGTAYDVNNNQTDIKAYFIPNGDLFDCYVYAPVNFMYIPSIANYLGKLHYSDGSTLMINDKVENIDLSATKLPTTGAGTILFGFFFDCANLKEIKGMQNWDTSKVTDFGGMFLGCESLETLDLSNFVFGSSVTSMQVLGMVGGNDDYISQMAKALGYDISSSLTGATTRDAKKAVLKALFAKLGRDVNQQENQSEAMLVTEIGKIICPKDMGDLVIGTPNYADFPNTTTYAISGTSNESKYLVSGKTLVKNS